MNRSIQVAVIAVIAALISSCGIFERLTGIAARKEAKQAQIKAESQALQQKVMRFGDQYVERIARRTTTLVAAGAEKTKLDMYGWQYTQATAVVQIAAGPNPAANALDMVVLVSLTRRIVEEQWPSRYGEIADPVVHQYVELEQDAWQLLTGILDDAQRRELASILADWHEKHRDLDSAAFVRFSDFAEAGAKEEVRVSPGLLGIIGLDPLAGIDPAVREFEQTRMLAERALYYAQRLPILLDMQFKLASARLAASPEVQQVLGTVQSVGEISASAQRVTDDLPALISREREAAISQFLAGLEVQNEQMRALTSDLKGALEAGALTAQSLDQLVKSTDTLVGRFARDPNAPPPAEPSRPFDINDYTRTITELAATARELQRLIQDAEQSSPAVARQVGELATQARGLVDFAVGRLLLVIAAILVAAIAYRMVTARIGRERRDSTSRSMSS